jgi:hypothetical protein
MAVRPKTKQKWKGMHIYKPKPKPPAFFIASGKGVSVFCTCCEPYEDDILLSAIKALIFKGKER